MSIISDFLGLFKSGKSKKKNIKKGGYKIILPSPPKGKFEKYNRPSYRRRIE